MAQKRSTRLAVVQLLGDHPPDFQCMIFNAIFINALAVEYLINHYKLLPLVK